MSKVEFTLVLVPRDKSGKPIQGIAPMEKKGTGLTLWDWMNQVTPKCLKKGEPWQEKNQT